MFEGDGFLICDSSDTCVHGHTAAIYSLLLVHHSFFPHMGKEPCPHISTRSKIGESMGARFRTSLSRHSITLAQSLDPYERPSSSLRFLVGGVIIGWDSHQLQVLSTTLGC